MGHRALVPACCSEGLAQRRPNSGQALDHCQCDGGMARTYLSVPMPHLARASQFLWAVLRRCFTLCRIGTLRKRLAAAIVRYMVSQRTSYLLVIGDREALAWILSAQRMAFPAHRGRSAAALQPADNLLLYTTRGCFRNPTRHRGRVIAHATVNSAVTPLDTPVEFSGRTFPLGCSLILDSLAPYGAGVDLAAQVPRMHSFPNPAVWGVYLRRTLAALDRHDYELLLKALREIAVEPTNVMSEYVAHGIPPTVAQ